jgi:hypothetical protein
MGPSTGFKDTRAMDGNNVLVDLDQIALIDPSLYICYDNFPGESDSYR